MLSLVEFINGTPVQSSYPRAGYDVMLDKQVGEGLHVKFSSLNQKN